MYVAVLLDPFTADNGFLDVVLAGGVCLVPLLAGLDPPTLTRFSLAAHVLFCTLSLVFSTKVLISFASLAIEDLGVVVALELFLMAILLTLDEVSTTIMDDFILLFLEPHLTEAVVSPLQVVAFDVCNSTRLSLEFTEPPPVKVDLQTALESRTSLIFSPVLLQSLAFSDGKEFIFVLLVDFPTLSEPLVTAAISV